MLEELPYLQPTNANLTEGVPAKHLESGQDIMVIEHLEINVPFKKENLGNIIAEILNASVLQKHLLS